MKVINANPIRLGKRKQKEKNALMEKFDEIKAYREEERSQRSTEIKKNQKKDRT